MNKKVEDLETLTSNGNILGSTEVAVSVSVLLTATDELAGNITVNQTCLSSFPFYMHFFVLAISLCSLTFCS